MNPNFSVLFDSLPSMEEVRSQISKISGERSYVRAETILDPRARLTKMGRPDIGRVPSITYFYFKIEPIDYEIKGFYDEAYIRIATIGSVNALTYFEAVIYKSLLILSGEYDKKIASPLLDIANFPYSKASKMKGFRP
ncbi:MAG: hypothetical protein AAFP92_18355 [Bacteroidota bacterium]